MSNLPSEQPKVQLPSAWNTSTKGLENRRISQQNIALKHGMFASVPIICKGHKCPYFDTCWIPTSDLQVGERCPIEIAAIVERFDAYCEELKIDPMVDITDAGTVKDVVDIEIMQLRADSLLATSGNFIQEVVAAVTPKGQEYYKPELHKAAELKSSLRAEKQKLLEKLAATRKDKQESLLGSQDPSSVASRIMAKARALQEAGLIIDVTPEETEVEPLPKTPDNEVTE